jgi:DNA repair protein RadC
LRYNSAGVILAHNHPSGNLRPSKQDIRLTEALQELLEKLNVVVLDHVIIGDDEYFSFREEGLI